MRLFEQNTKDWKSSFGVEGSRHDSAEPDNRKDKRGSFPGHPPLRVPLPQVKNEVFFC